MNSNCLSVVKLKLLLVLPPVLHTKLLLSLKGFFLPFLNCNIIRVPSDLNFLQKEVYEHMASLYDRTSYTLNVVELRLSIQT